MAVERCELSELPKDQCAHCKAGTRVLPDEIQVPGDHRPTAGPWITAQLHGRCAGNRRHQVQPGDQIRSDGAGGWLCADCG